MTEYAYHGLRIVSDVDLGLPEFDPSLGGLGTLAMRRVDALPHAPEPLWTSDRTGYSYHLLGDGRALVTCEAGGFLIAEGEIGIGFDAWTLEARAYLLGAVVALWFELRGLPVLHASCVGVGRAAIGLLGESTAGKSTLSAGLVASGCTLLGDDLLPLARSGTGYEVYASAPIARLWPDAAAHFVGDHEAFERIVPSRDKRAIRASALGEPVAEGRRQGGRARLAALYVLERRRDVDEARVEALTPPGALAALVALSFLGEALERFPSRPQRFQALARAVRAVPVRRLVYPSGFEHLSRVAAALVADAEGCPA